MSLLKKRITQEGRKQSQLAAAIAEKAKEPPGTVESRLSAIGSPEGDAYFFSEKAPKRLTALASELGIEESELRALRDVPTLVLDPRLPPEAITFIRDAAGSAYDVETVDEAGAELWQRLRDKAQSERHAIIVASDLRESRPYYSGASVEHTELVRVPRGFRLASRPELIPVPPRPAAPTHTPAGVPLLRGAALKHWLGDRWPYELEELELRASQRDEELVCTLAEVDRHISQYVTFRDGIFWTDELPAGMAEAFAPHSVKSWKTELHARVEGRNPYRSTLSGKEFGSPGEKYVEALQAAERGKHGVSVPSVLVPPVAQSGELAAGFREAIANLLERTTTSGTQCGHMAHSRCNCGLVSLYFPHVLRVLAQSELVVAQEPGAIVGSADLGAGRVGAFRLVRYGHDQPAPLVLIRATLGDLERASDYLVDAGDLVLALCVFLVPALLGRSGPTSSASSVTRDE